MQKETTFLKIALNMLRLQIPKYININIKIFNKFVKKLFKMYTNKFLKFIKKNVRYNVFGEFFDFNFF